MTETLLVACTVGFAHAFEADHLVAVGNMVTQRTNTLSAIKDGIFWGLGHTSVILLAGTVYMAGRFMLNETDFHYLEALVGIMLVLLGFLRLYQFVTNTQNSHKHNADGSHKFAYGIGAIHGLAGSGAVLLTVLSQNNETLKGILYILVFGIGSILGMMVAAGIFSIPFSSRFLKNKWLSHLLTVVSCMLCIGLGVFIFYKNLL